MPNAAYKALFPANSFVDVELSNIAEVFASEVDTPQRRRLSSQLRLFIGYLQNLGLTSFEMWIDGSFTTAKPNPMDIDVVCFIHRAQIEKLSDENCEMLKHLASEEGHPYVREKWNIDYYHCPFDSLNDRNYWKEQFSKDEYGEPKGIGRIKL
ncbi:hypothetical protein HAP94_20690 [Acidithiobacillus ferrivorans]|jgi:hypothetical protein|nr:hypothetical protein [Acidithiobacillus ferrivorans]